LSIRWTHKKLSLSWKWKKQLNFYCLNSHVEHIWLCLSKILNSDCQFRCDFFCILLTFWNKCVAKSLNWILMKGLKSLTRLLLTKPDNWFRSHDTLFKTCYGCFEPYMAYDENSYRYRLKNFKFFTLSPIRSCPPALHKKQKKGHCQFWKKKILKKCACLYFKDANQKYLNIAFSKEKLNCYNFIVETTCLNLFYLIFPPNTQPTEL